MRNEVIKPRAPIPNSKKIEGSGTADIDSEKLIPFIGWKPLVLVPSRLIVADAEVAVNKISVTPNALSVWIPFRLVIVPIDFDSSIPPTTKGVTVPPPDPNS